MGARESSSTLLNHPLRSRSLSSSLRSRSPNSNNTPAPPSIQHIARLPSPAHLALHSPDHPGSSPAAAYHQDHNRTLAVAARTVLAVGSTCHLAVAVDRSTRLVAGRCCNIVVAGRRTGLGSCRVARGQRRLVVERKGSPEAHFRFEV